LITVLNRKQDAFDEKEKEKCLQQTYDVRGKKKYQHRNVNDLKEDFKEDLILRYDKETFGLYFSLKQVSSCMGLG